jgi:hypothetical protein
MELAVELLGSLHPTTSGVHGDEGADQVRVVWEEALLRDLAMDADALAEILPPGALLEQGDEGLSAELHGYGGMEMKATSASLQQKTAQRTPNVTGSVFCLFLLYMKERRTDRERWFLSSNFWFLFAIPRMIRSQLPIESGTSDLESRKRNRGWILEPCDV